MAERQAGKPSTIRLSDLDMATLEAIARAESCTISSLLREAVAALIAQRRADPGFQARLAERARLDRDLLERLRDGGGSP